MSDCQEDQTAPDLLNRLSAIQRDPTNPFAPMERPGWTEPQPVAWRARFREERIWMLTASERHSDKYVIAEPLYLHPPATASSDDTVSVWAAVWQPIESAPRDGLPILTYSDDCAESETQMVMWWSRDKAARCGFGWEAYEVSHMLCPTHWMPLPKPPEIAGKNAREGQS